MLSGITHTAIGVAVAGTIGGSVVLQPSQKPLEEAVFLERVALRVERVATLPPETRDYLVTLTSRYTDRPGNNAHELRQARALRRVADVIARKSEHR